MRNFELGKKFAMIFIAFRSFQSLLTKKDQSSCLECVHKHLKENGIFLLDLFAPRHDILAQVQIYMDNFYDKENDAYVFRWAEDKYDLAKQTLKEDRFYE